MICQRMRRRFKVNVEGVLITHAVFEAGKEFYIASSSPDARRRCDEVWTRWCEANREGCAAIYRREMKFYPRRRRRAFEHGDGHRGRAVRDFTVFPGVFSIVRRLQHGSGDKRCQLP